MANSNASSFAPFPRSRDSSPPTQTPLSGMTRAEPSATPDPNRPIFASVLTRSPETIVEQSSESMGFENVELGLPVAPTASQRGAWQDRPLDSVIVTAVTARNDSAPEMTAAQVDEERRAAALRLRYRVIIFVFSALAAGCLVVTVVVGVTSSHEQE